MIKAVTFDCWDTLIIDDAGRDAKMSEYLESVCQKNSISLADKNITDAFEKEDKLREEYVAACLKAKNAGMKAILFTGINKKYKDITTADCVTESCDELNQVLASLK